MATAVVSTDVLQAMLEKVRNKLQVYFETSDQISGLIGKGEVETISDKLYRIPIQLYQGGTYQKFDAEAGDMGSGTGLKVDKLTAGYIYSNYAVEVSLRAIDTTASKEQSIVQAFAKMMSGKMDEIKANDDIAFHGNGTGTLTNASSLYTSSTTDSYTFAGATDYLGVGKLRPGMAVTVWASTLATKRVTSVTPIVITNIDWSNKVVYLSGTVTAGATTDVLAVANITTDSTLAYGQSGWPLTGDTWRHGFQYANDADSTKYYLGQLKSTITELLPNRVNALGSALTFQHGLLYQDQIIARRDPEVYKGTIGVAHMSQRAAVHNLGIAISTWMRSSSEKMIDMMPSNIGYSDTFDFAGIKCYLSKRQDRSRIDFLVPSLWGRAQLHDTKLYDVGGQTIFEGRTSSGNLKASQQFFVVQAYDFVDFDPGAAGMIDTLALPSGYGN